MVPQWATAAALPEDVVEWARPSWGRGCSCCATAAAAALGDARACAPPDGGGGSGDATGAAGCPGDRLALQRPPVHAGCSGEAANGYARRLVRQLQHERAGEGDDTFAAHQPASYVVLPVTLPVPPPELAEYMHCLRGEGIEAANALLFGDELVVTPAAAKPYASGDAERALRTRSGAVGAFVASLFHAIQSAAPTNVELAGWDLFHSHCFLHCGSQEEGGGGAGSAAAVDVDIDLGMLFHAREFPAEYKKCSWHAVQPIGDDSMGGQSDPRLGTRCSLADPDYPLRNYLWLLSTNQIVLIDPRWRKQEEEGLEEKQEQEVDECPLHPLVSRGEFFTVDTSRLGTVSETESASLWLPLCGG
jgi:hypothetical protein